MNAKILRLSAVKVLTGLSRSSVYQKIADGDFPKSIALGPRAVGWLESDVESWIERKVEASRKLAVKRLA
jgi:prophage regulatory protein